MLTAFLPTLMCLPACLLFLSTTQVLFDKSPQSVWNMRPDSLALVLSLANVGAGARCLVLENCQVRQLFRGVVCAPQENGWLYVAGCAVCTPQSAC